jgi:hypothetical protein
LIQYRAGFSPGFTGLFPARGAGANWGKAAPAHHNLIAPLWSSGINAYSQRVRLWSLFYFLEKKMDITATVTTDTDHKEYVISDDARRRIENTFTYHAPKGDQTCRYAGLRNTAKELAFLIEAYVPNSREKSLALTKLEECIMHANAGIARNE